MEISTDVRKMQLLWAGLGIVAALTCGWGVQRLSGQVPYSPLLGVAAYLAVWIPFLAALTASFWSETYVRAIAWLGLRLRPLDLLWGIGIGSMVRAFDAALRLSVTGSTGLDRQPALSAIGNLSTETIAWGVLAPVLIAPVLEEIYFRGLIQRALAETFAMLGSVARWSAAVVLTSALFAGVHSLLLLTSPREALLTGLTTFVFALAAGTTAAATRRLGGAIVGHIVFNGLGMLLTWSA